MLRKLVRALGFRFPRIITHRIGHMAGDVDLFLRANPRAWTWFWRIASESVANQALLDLWGKHVRMLSPRWTRWLGALGLLERCDPLGPEYRAWHSPGVLVRAAEEFPKPYQGQFVAFHARDPAYLAATSTQDFSYHDYRDASIAAMLPAMDLVTQRGLKAVRMGRHVAEPLVTDNPAIIDYPKAHNEHMDLWLAAACKFYIGTPNGTAQLPLLFDRPIAYTNCVPLWMMNWGRGCLYIPKLMRDRSSGGILTWDAVQKLGAFDHEARSGLTSGWYTERGIEPVENTAEDILDLCTDMLDGERGAAPTVEQIAWKARYFAGQAEREWAPNLGPSFARKYVGLMG